LTRIDRGHGQHALIGADWGQKGILRARGTWATAFGLPVMPMAHPAYLLRNPIAKREAWADLLADTGEVEGEMSRIDETKDFIPVRIAVLTVSDTRTSPTTGQAIRWSSG
jgi:hypothetical protein